MHRTITQKVLDDHLTWGQPIPGQEAGIRIDQTLTHDATGTMAFLQFEAMGIERVKTELSLVYIDHNTIQVGPENADDHRYLQTVAARYGAVFSRAGNGICHQVHLERHALPGKTLLGSDSHTCMCGAMGMIAIGAGGLDVAAAMAGSPFYLTYPRVINIRLRGQLQPWVSAKDIILTVLETFSTQGNVGCVFEYTGEGVETLSVPERATIANMGAECGVTTSVFPSDERTREFLAAQGRDAAYVALEADEGAQYHRVVEIDLGMIQPKVACPHSPGNVKNVRDMDAQAVGQVCIGSCTNSSYRDLAIVAEIVRGKAVHPDVSLVIAPGSRQVLQMMTRASSLGALLDSGARLQECACGFCIGNSQSPMSEGISLRTSNRNFLGRSGTASAQVYLCSPETAAASAITGRITDPRDLGAVYPRVEMPERFIADDQLLVYPAKGPGRAEVHRGPHMGPVPMNAPLPRDIHGIVCIKLGDMITTDHIVPGGQRMKYRSNVEKYAEFMFEVVDASFYQRAREIRDRGKHNIIVAGWSYGQGSSREHAAMCPMYLGVKMVIAKSFERIHRNNLVNFGIVPATFVVEDDYEWIHQGDELDMDDITVQMESDRPMAVLNRSQGRRFEVSCALSERERRIVMAGGTLPYLRDRLVADPGSPAAKG